MTRDELKAAFDEQCPVIHKERGNNMNIIQFLFANWDSVLVVLAFLALIVVLIKRGETKVLNKVLFSLVMEWLTEQED